MDCRVNRKSRAVHRMVALHHIAMMIDPDQVGDFHLTEMHAVGIDPESVSELGVARGDMPSDTFIKSKAGEQPKRASELLLAMQPFLCQRAELGDGRKAARVAITQMLLVQLNNRQLGVIVHDVSYGFF